MLSWAPEERLSQMRESQGRGTRSPGVTHPGNLPSQGWDRHQEALGPRACHGPQRKHPLTRVGRITPDKPSRTWAGVPGVTCPRRGWAKAPEEWPPWGWGQPPRQRLPRAEGVPPWTENTQGLTPSGAERKPPGKRNHTPTVNPDLNGGAWKQLTKWQ